jgi:RNA-dependent RNA polymerase
MLQISLWIISILMYVDVIDQCSNVYDELPLKILFNNMIQVLGVVATNWLLTADISGMGIFDPDCYTLAQLHSDAVDYPKSGQPVPQNSIPKPKSKIKPDWKAPETVNDSNRGDYYESSRAIGRLHRAIDLPIEDLQAQYRPRRRQTKRKAKSDRVVDGLTQGLMNLDVDTVRDDNLVFAVVEDRVQEYIDTDAAFSQSAQVDAVANLYSRYKSDLRGHCAANTLSSSRFAQLSEEEALMGTIIQKTSVPRRRKDAMTKLRESTDFLVKAVREQLEGDDNSDDYQYLERAWIAWTISVSRRNASDQFGAASFGWIALGAVFDAIGQIEKQMTTF